MRGSFKGCCHAASTGLQQLCVSQAEIDSYNAAGQGVLEAATEQGGGAIETASSALSALGPTWLASGQPVGSLLAIVISSLSSMQPLQRLPLLTATLQGLPQVGCQVETLQDSGSSCLDPRYMPHFSASFLLTDLRLHRG